MGKRKNFCICNYNFFLVRGEQQTVLNTKLYKGQLAIHFLNHILEQPNGASFHHFQKQSTDTHFQLNQTLSLNKSSILKESYILNISVFFCQIYVNSKLRNHFNLWRCKRLPQFSTNFDQLLSHKFWLVYGLSNARFHKLARNTMVQYRACIEKIIYENLYQSRSI